MIASDPRLPFGRHPLAGGGMSLTIIASLFVYSCTAIASVPARQASIEDSFSMN